MLKLGLALALGLGLGQGLGGSVHAVIALWCENRGDPFMICCDYILVIKCFI